MKVPSSLQGSPPAPAFPALLLTRSFPATPTLTGLVLAGASLGDGVCVPV